MASRGTKIAAVVVVIIVIVVVVVAAWYLLKDDNDSVVTPEGDEYTFLVEDQEGVYFWISGQGDNAENALINAADSFGIDLVPSYDSDGNPAGIDSMFGMAMEEVSADEWMYWNQFVWDGSEWTYSSYTMEKVDIEYCNGYVALVYGGWVQPEDIDVTPSDAVVWDKSTSGTVFTIKSESGLWFKVNGSGDTLFDAYVATMEKYKIPYETNANGIEGMFGLYMTENSDGNWVYWQQFQVIDGEEVESTSYMTHMSCADNPEFVLIYEEYVWLG